MIATAIGDVLPVAIAVAISPLAIITSIVFLLSDHGRIKAALFILGWCITLLILTGIAVVITDAVEEDAPVETENGVSIVSLILGVGFLILAAYAWKGRPKPGELAKEAKVLARISGMSGITVLGLGMVEGVAIIKNTPLSLGAGARIAEDTQGGTSAWVAVGVFVILASLGMIVPLIVAIVGGRRLDPALASFRQWLEDNISPITIVTLLVVGAYFLGKGLAIFS
ncbi:GAP family protein [Gordonia sp. NPDC003429]